jgi:hypothetical protein
MPLVVILLWMTSVLVVEVLGAESVKRSLANGDR